MEDKYYNSLCESVALKPFAENIPLANYFSTETLANQESDARFAASMQVLLELVIAENATTQKVDKALIDYYIAQVDKLLAADLNEILHNDKFQEVESLWTSLKYLVDNTDFKSNIKIELLNVNQETLAEDFAESSETSQAALYKLIYDKEYDTPGGEPFTAMISSFAFNSTAYDIMLLKNIAKVAAVAHCPFIASATSQFFKKNSHSEVANIDDLTAYMERADFIKWNSFRESEDARYIGLSLPNFLLRQPYGEDNPVREFSFVEQLSTDSDYLWGGASFAFAANLSESFRKFGWCVNIRGPEAGGKVENLPLHKYLGSRGTLTKIPTQTLISETRELNFANLGFIPLSYYKNSDYACFFSANSVQKPIVYDDNEAAVNARINSRLPYIFLSSRIAHYLKVMQRENIGAAKSRSHQEDELNKWLNTLVTKMNNPGPELAASHPLREARVVVEEIADNPGFYKVNLHAVPHFQIEGLDVKLSLVGQLPNNN